MLFLTFFQGLRQIQVMQSYLQSKTMRSLLSRSTPSAELCATSSLRCRALLLSRTLLRGAACSSDSTLLKDLTGSDRGPPVAAHDRSPDLLFGGGLVLGRSGSSQSCFLHFRFSLKLELIFASDSNFTFPILIAFQNGFEGIMPHQWGTGSCKRFATPCRGH